jgi:sialate O-acetylesterase
MHWLDEYDIGNNLWSAENFDDSNWKTVRIPGGFQELGVGAVPSVCWFRKEITLPDPLPGGSATIHLGSIEKMDTTYINGQWVGASSWVENPRVYVIKNGVLKLGKNILAIRVFKMKSPGGFLGKPNELKLVLGDKTEIPLAGEWKGALRVAGKSTGHTLQWRRTSRRSVPHRRLAGNHKKCEAVVIL